MGVPALPRLYAEIGRVLFRAREEVSRGLHRLCVERQGLESLGVVLPVHGRELVIITVRRARRQGEALEGLWCFWYSLARVTGFRGEWEKHNHDVWKGLRHGECDMTSLNHGNPSPTLIYVRRPSAKGRRLTTRRRCASSCTRWRTRMWKASRL